MKSYLSIRETAEKWGVSERRINQYCAEECIPPAGSVSGRNALLMRWLPVLCLTTQTLCRS